MTPKDTDQNGNIIQNDGLWISIPDNYKETGQRKNFNDTN